MAKGEKFIDIDKEFLMATATLIGTAIGAGIFGLPYVVSKAGLLPSLAMMFFLGVMMLISNLMFGEIILRTAGHSRLVGCAKKYMGESGKHFASLVSFLMLYSSNLVYIILSGMFLNSLLFPVFGGDEFIYGTLAFLFVSLVTYFDSKLFSEIESWLVLFLVIVIGAVSFKSVFYIDVRNYATGDVSQFFPLFGVLLFSLGAGSAIPEVVSIIKKRRDGIEKAITWGTIFYTLAYGIFAAAVVGVTGAATSEESFAGLSLSIGDGVVTAGFLLGILAVATTYLVINDAIRDILRYDYHLKGKMSWFLASIVPYLFFVVGFRDFIQVITFAGSVTGGLFGILVIIIFYNAKVKGDQKPAYEINIPREISFLMIAVYLLGIIYEIIYNL
ncbi:MAG: aromatic amino acid transport family protein [Patescibacteria group bacterium]